MRLVALSSLTIMLFGIPTVHAQSVLLNPSGNQTVTQPSGTTLSVNSLQKVLNATLFSGSDIGTQINSAFASCESGSPTICTVYVPAGVYTDTTTVTYPTYSYGGYRLIFDASATINYEGSTYFIQAKPSTAQSGMRVDISGGTIQCAVASCGAASAIDLVTADGHIYNMAIRNFDNGGIGILLDGTNSDHIDHVSLTNNTWDVYLAPYEDATLGGYSPNAITVEDSSLGGSTTNEGWCIYSALNNKDGEPIQSYGQNNTFRNNIFEGCGSSTQGGAIFVQEDWDDVIEGNYMEVGVNDIAIGSVSGQPSLTQGPSNSVGTTVKDNFFVISSPLPAGTILEYAAIDTAIEHNTEFSGTSNCFVYAYNVGGFNNIVGNHTSTHSLTCVTSPAFQFATSVNVPSGAAYQVNGTPGFTGTKVAGACTFTVTGGIITGVSGC